MTSAKLVSRLPMRYSTRKRIKRGMAEDTGQTGFTHRREEEGGEGRWTGGT